MDIRISLELVETRSVPFFGFCNAIYTTVVLCSVQASFCGVLLLFEGLVQAFRAKLQGFKLASSRLQQEESGCRRCGLEGCSCFLKEKVRSVGKLPKGVDTFGIAFQRGKCWGPAGQETPVTGWRNIGGRWEGEEEKKEDWEDEGVYMREKSL